MRKSEITRATVNVRRICQFTPMSDEKCHDRATIQLKIVSYIPGKLPLTGVSHLCEEHADTITGYYEREWANHPEMFEDDDEQN